MVEHSLTPKQKKILEFISGFLDEKGYGPSQQEIARHFGFSSLGTVQNYLTRLQAQGLLEKSLNARRGVKVLPPQPHTAESFAEGTDEESSRPTAHEHPHSTAAMVSLPLVGKVAAGLPIEAIQHAETLDVPASMIGSGEHMVLKVQGDSMIGDGILSGDYVIIRKQGSAQNGQTVVALVNNEATIKRFYRKGKGVELHAANPAYEPLIVEAMTEATAGPPDFRIEGILVGLIRRLE